MTKMHQWLVLGFVACLGISGFVAAAASKPAVRLDPVAHIGPNGSPVRSTNDVDGEFQLIRLSDGHDYWFYRDGNRDKGYAAMAHSPECEVCQPKTGT